MSPSTEPVMPEVPPADESAVDRACNRLRQLVRQGRFVGGQPLIEADLTITLAVARSTVREALRRLESEGLLVGRARGLQVRRLSRKDVVDLYELREVLEGLSARRAADATGTPFGITRGRLAEERRIWRKAAGSEVVAAYSDLNRAFHELLLHSAGNNHLPRMLDHTLMVLFASQFRPWLTTVSLTVAARQHLEILAAVEARESQEAEQAMRRHIRSSAAMILDLPGDAFA